LKDLHRLGFIDISRQGHGVRGEYTKYAISTRWQAYDTPDWQEIPFPKSFKEGFTSDEYIEKRKKNSVQKRTLIAFENGRYEGSEPAYSVQKRTLKTPLSVNSQRSKTNVSIDLVMPTGSKKKSKKRSSAPDTGSKDIATASKTKIRPAAIPSWPDQGRVLDLCDKLTLDAINRFGGDHLHRDEMVTARNLTDIINRAVGSRVTN
jgi:hypothetical protein